MFQPSPDVIGSIYDAAVEAGLWQNALDSVAGRIGARASALVIRDFGETPYAVNAVSSVYARMFANGTGQYYVENLLRYEEQQLEHISRRNAWDIIRDEDMGVPQQDLDMRPDYAFLRQHAGVGRRLGFRLNDNNGWFDALTIGFGIETGRIPDSVLAEVRPYLPHLAKSVELGRAFTALKSRYNAVLTVLDQINIGILLTLGSSEILVANKEAERIMSERGGVGRSHLNLLVCRSLDQTAQLRAYIAEAAATAAGAANAAQRHMPVICASGKDPLLAEVTPIRDGADELNSGLRGAIVILIDPDREDVLNIGKFASLYSLTKAETEVCELMIKGLSARGIAERRETTSHTATSQIKAVYAKTGAASRSALIRLVVRTLPPILQV